MNQLHALMLMASFCWIAGAAIGNAFLAMVGFVGMTLTLAKRLLRSSE